MDRIWLCNLKRLSLQKKIIVCKTNSFPEKENVKNCSGAWNRTVRNS